jgi:predicted DsbA family dithiol-disulfide isomerase
MTEFLAFEYTDVNSFEAWSAEPVLRRVRRRYEDVAWWRSVQATPKRSQAAPEIERARWLAAATAPVPARLEYLAATPASAARAAHAARHQGRHRAEAVLRRLREATFVHGRPVDDVDGIHAAVAGIPDLDVWRLIRDLDSPDVVWSVDTDHKMTLRHGFSAPTVLFRGPRGDIAVRGVQSFESYVTAAETVAPGITGLLWAPPLSPDALLERYRSLTLADLGNAAPPTYAVRLQTATTPLWLHPAEPAAGRLAEAA